MLTDDHLASMTVMLVDHADQHRERSSGSTSVRSRWRTITNLHRRSKSRQEAVTEASPDGAGIASEAVGSNPKLAVGGIDGGTPQILDQR